MITMKAWKDPQPGVILLGLKLCMTHTREHCSSLNQEKSTSSLSDIITDVSVMMEDTVDILQRKVESVLKANKMSPAEVTGFKNVFQNVELRDPFHSLQSEYLQTKYFRDHMGLVVCNTL